MGYIRKRKHIERANDTEQHRWTRLHLLRAQKGLCGICGNPITDMKDASVDHIVPLSLGGKQIPSNMQAAHIKCNFAKGANTNHEQ